MSYREEIVQCPYNLHHSILKSRFITHLCKCRKQYTGTDFSTCPFNATHSIPRPEYQYHISNCPDRRHLESHMFVNADDRRNQNTGNKTKISDSSENWEDEQQESYLDIKETAITTKPVLRLPCGKSKSQRRKFFAEEIEKFEALKNGESINNSKEGPSHSMDKSTSRLPSAGIGLGRGIRVDLDNYEGDEDDEDDAYEAYTLMLQTRGRGRAITISSSED